MASSSGALQNVAAEERLTALRNFVELFRGGMANITPLFIGVREHLGTNADIDELRGLVDSYAMSHDDCGVIGACAILKAGLRCRLLGENAWYQEWHAYHDHLETIFWSLPVKTSSERSTLQDAKLWIASEIALCWQLEQTHGSRRAFRFLMATFGAAAGSGYPAGNHECAMPEGYGHFNGGLIERVRREIVEPRVEEFRNHLPSRGDRARLWEEWLDYPDIPPSVASLLNVEWARVMPPRELAQLRRAAKSRNGHAPKLP